MYTAVFGANVAIRPYRPSDLGPLFDAARESIEEVHPWLSWCHPELSRKECMAFLQSREEAWSKGEDYSFAIVDAQTDRYLGGCSLNQVNRIHKFANLGYWVRTSCTGRGIATAAVILAARFGLEELGLNRIEIVSAAENRASQRVAEKAGARREGILRCRLITYGKALDAVLYSLTRQDMFFQAG